MPVPPEMTEEEMANTALNVVDLTIGHVLRTGLAKRPHLYAAVGTRDRGILADRHYNLDKKPWENPYVEIAQSKFRISQLTGLPSREVQLMYPEMLEELGLRDTLFWGSAVLLDDVAACSGVEAWFDEMFSKMLVHTMFALRRVQAMPASEEAANMRAAAIAAGKAFLPNYYS